MSVEEKIKILYNTDKWLTSIQVVMADGTTHLLREYTYDNNGQIRTIKDYRNILTGAADDVTVCHFNYDLFGRITEIRYADGDSVETKEFYQYVYDKNNNLLTETFFNHYPASEEDWVEDQRIQKVEGSGTINYYYDVDTVLYTTNELNELTAVNHMGTQNNVICTSRFGEKNAEHLYYYNKDIRESTTNLIDSSGNGVVSYQYTDFGETSIHGQEDFYNEICYTGGIYDEGTQLYYLNARYYNPADGRFLTEDTYRGESTDPSSMHLYAYCANNPITKADPSGHIAISRIIGAGVGGVIGGYAAYRYAKKKGLKGWKKKCKVLTKITGKPHCFTGHTRIITRSGKKEIKDIEEGDEVPSANPYTGEISYKKVIATTRSEVDTIVLVRVNGEEIETTEIHPFWVI